MDLGDGDGRHVKVIFDIYVQLSTHISKKNKNFAEKVCKSQK